MIVGISIENAHHYAGALPSTLECRYRAFIERQQWPMPTFKKMEYDDYDNPSTVYLSWCDDDGIVRGTTRLAPTDRPYMIKDNWPDAVTNIDLPSSPTIYEASRMCVDHHLPRELRRHILNELVCAYAEYCLKHGIEYMIGVMPPKIWEYCFHRAGWPIEIVGPEYVLPDGDMFTAGKMTPSEKILQNIRKTCGFNEPVLHNNSKMTYKNGVALNAKAA